MTEKSSFARPVGLRRRWALLTVFVVLQSSAVTVWAKGGGARNAASSASGESQNRVLSFFPFFKTASQVAYHHPFVPMNIFRLKGGGSSPGQQQCSYGGVAYPYILGDVSPRSNQLRYASTHLHTLSLPS